MRVSEDAMLTIVNTLKMAGVSFSRRMARNELASGIAKR